MLKERIITALILAPVALGCVLFLPPIAFSVVIALVIMLGGWEWANLAGFKEGWQRYTFAAVIGIACLLASVIPEVWVLAVAVIWWLLAFFMVKQYPESARYCESRWLRLVMGVFTLVPAWTALVELKQVSPDGLSIIMVLLLIWAADVGAYFAGKSLGRHKLAVNVSPKKTIEGLVGGLLASLCVAAVIGLYYDFTFARGLGFLLLTIVVVLVSVLGDLFESLLKRERGIKDSSNLLPGHGGILDRIDSLTAAIPVFALALVVSGS
ncbi:phosphatidate cytidylyltransferase [Endozoicomonas sp. OPT23]|uniref:phosphatidate cytidylyltransferase n=1 Tax=Endozoicomonas sp. OPT23 TaxID=2072845 RepID=UPI001DFBC6BA|nr:phosphatidate cytidylyltransferase [Endozoicomonas sp. OPT23]